MHEKKHETTNGSIFSCWIFVVISFENWYSMEFRMKLYSLSLSLSSLLGINCYEKLNLLFTEMKLKIHEQTFPISKHSNSLSLSSTLYILSECIGDFSGIFENVSQNYLLFMCYGFSNWNCCIGIALYFHKNNLMEIFFLQFFKVFSVRYYGVVVLVLLTPSPSNKIIFELIRRFLSFYHKKLPNRMPF